MPRKALAWLMLNTFGLKLIYPGSMRWLLQPLLAPTITEQRAKLVTNSGGLRVKLKTADGNAIDAMYFDRRQKVPNGDILVIVCEGNAGFYELGMLNTALEAGYSVIGWNHPGFWGSTGSPLPSQDAFAADAVMQFANKELAFKAEDVLIYGWSIGGFPASWLAMNYPQVRGVILDATFDHLLPLAIPRMPASFEPLVTTAINEFVNLDVAQQVNNYDGPVRFIRRLRDEMISTDDEEHSVGSNRGNDLLMAFLGRRFPHLAEALPHLAIFLATDKESQKQMRASLDVNAETLSVLISSYVEEFGSSYPFAEFGQDWPLERKTEVLQFLVSGFIFKLSTYTCYLQLYMQASQHLTDFDANHNSPLPQDKFRPPWSPKTKI